MECMLFGVATDGDKKKKTILRAHNNTHFKKKKKKRQMGSGHVNRIKSVAWANSASSRVWL